MPSLLDADNVGQEGPKPNTKGFKAGDRVLDNAFRPGTVVDDDAKRAEHPGFVPVQWDAGARTMAMPEILTPIDSRSASPQAGRGQTSDLNTAAAEPNGQLPVLLTIGRFAAEIGTSKAYVYARISEGEIPVVNLGSEERRMWRIPAKALNNFIENRKVA